jgi:BNR repeat-containing family member
MCTRGAVGRAGAGWRRGLGLALLAALCLAGPAEARHRFGIFGRGSWCWFADPRAVHIVSPRNITIVAWINWRGAIVVGSYDANLGRISKHVVGYQFRDDHSSPSILVEPGGRLTVFWSGHNGRKLKYRTTVRPEDIRRWGPLRQVHSGLPGGRGFTYPNPEMLPAEGNRLYLFWRGSNWGQDYATRSPAGRWSQARRLIENPGERPYVKVGSDGRNTIALAFTDGHPREMTTSIYFAAYRRGWLRTAGGRRIARIGRRPITPGEASLVYDGRAAHASGWVWDVAFDRHHRPVIVYATFPSSGDHRYYYARFDGHRWVSHFLTLGGPTISPGTIEQQYSGGLALDHNLPSTVYLSRKAGGWYEIERWSTPDGGRTWHRQVVVRTPGENNVRPVVPRGPAGGPLQLLWLHGDYRSYTTYRTSIAFERER